MKREKLLLEHRPGRKHDGVIVTLKPNLRWCSDSFEIRCCSGERVHVAFALDCCDSELVGFVARSEPLCGENIRDMMVQAVESRFGAGSRKLPTPMEWLSDNGSIYASNEPREFGAGIGFEMCTTPPYSPESNGIAKSLVKSFESDYVYLADLWTADDVLRLLPTWVDDYNHVRPTRASKCFHPLNSGISNWHHERVRPVGGYSTRKRARAAFDGIVLTRKARRVPLCWGTVWALLANKYGVAARCPRPHPRNGQVAGAFVLSAGNPEFGYWRDIEILRAFFAHAILLTKRCGGERTSAPIQFSALADAEPSRISGAGDRKTTTPSSRLQNQQ